MNRKVEVIYFTILALKFKIVYLYQLRNMKEQVAENYIRYPTTGATTLYKCFTFEVTYLNKNYILSINSIILFNIPINVLFNNRARSILQTLSNATFSIYFLQKLTAKRKSCTFYFI